jgi:hypothetical protein
LFSKTIVFGVNDEVTVHDRPEVPASALATAETETAVPSVEGALPALSQSSQYSATAGSAEDKSFRETRYSRYCTALTADLKPRVDEKPMAPPTGGELDDGRVSALHRSRMVSSAVNSPNVGVSNASRIFSSQRFEP